MIREDRVLMAQLGRVNSQVPGFVLAFLDGTVSPDEQIAMAQQFVDLAEALLHHANERKRLVIDGDVTGLTEATAPLKQYLQAQTEQPVSTDPDQTPPTGQMVLGDPNSPEG